MSVQTLVAQVLMVCASRVPFFVIVKPSPDQIKTVLESEYKRNPAKGPNAHPRERQKNAISIHQYVWFADCLAPFCAFCMDKEVALRKQDKLSQMLIMVVANVRLYLGCRMC